MHRAADYAVNPVIGKLVGDEGAVTQDAARHMQRRILSPMSIFLKTSVSLLRTIWATPCFVREVLQIAFSGLIIPWGNPMMVEQQKPTTPCVHPILRVT